jgi:hypothetical protein
MQFGKLKIKCRVVGPEQSPWSGRIHQPEQTVFAYKVSVSAGSARYSTKAWGSIHDYQSAKHDCSGVSAMVIDELLSANADPEEFVSMVMGDATGREALKRGRGAEKVVRAAKKFNYQDLVAAVEEAREKGLL